MHSQYFSFSHYYHYSITPPGPACSLRNNLNVFKSRYPLLTLLSYPSRKEKKKFPQKLKPPRSGRKINICEVKKKVTTIIGVPAKNCLGGQTKNTPHNIYGENGLYVERKDCQHNFFIHFPMPPPPPGERLPPPPLRAPIMISTHLISFV